MTREQATREALDVARSERVDMVVTFNPYDDEAETNADAFGYFPASAHRIFKHETVVARITVAGSETLIEVA